MVINPIREKACRVVCAEAPKRQEMGMNSEGARKPGILRSILQKALPVTLFLFGTTPVPAEDLLPRGTPSPWAETDSPETLPAPNATGSTGVACLPLEAQE